MSHNDHKVARDSAGFSRLSWITGRYTGLVVVATNSAPRLQDCLIHPLSVVSVVTAVILCMTTQQ